MNIFVLYNGYVEIETDAFGSKCSFIIMSSQTGRGHIPAEQYPNGQSKREIQVIGKKVRAWSGTRQGRTSNPRNRENT